jgi:hypothetical protein
MEVKFCVCIYRYSMFTHKFLEKGIFYVGCVKKNVSRIAILSVNICLF